MARKFKKNPSMTQVVLPGYGRLTSGEVEGDQYARFVPSLLVEVTEEPVPVVEETLKPLSLVEVEEVEVEALSASASIADETESSLADTVELEADPAVPADQTAPEQPPEQPSPGPSKVPGKKKK
jgi:hypothetical protein